jgi:hypothetical protein
MIGGSRFRRCGRGVRTTWMASAPSLQLV